MPRALSPWRARPAPGAAAAAVRGSRCGVRNMKSLTCSQYALSTSCYCMLLTAAKRPRVLPGARTFSVLNLVLYALVAGVFTTNSKALLSSGSRAPGWYTLASTDPPLGLDKKHRRWEVFATG